MKKTRTSRDHILTSDAQAKVTVIGKQYIDLVVLPNTNFNLEIDFLEPGAQAYVFGTYDLRGKQFAKLNVWLAHCRENTKCVFELRGVLRDASVSEFTGRILIDKQASGTDTYLSHRTLVLGDFTRNVSTPTLEINTDDVKAGHASSTGRIDEEQLYYLMARGMSRQSAEAIIIEGFLLPKTYD